MTISKALKLSAIVLVAISCVNNREAKLKTDLETLPINRGEIALCGSGADKFGKVDFSQSCSEKVQGDFNLAAALLHSFEYADAEKIFAKVVDADPNCLMGYWGLAMSYFHPLWSPPDSVDLRKGAAIIAIGRSVVNDKSSRESQYLEAIATIYDDYKSLDYHTRVGKFEKACNEIFVKNPDDKEAAIFYALSLDASADPKDKSFINQKKSGKILSELFTKEPNHPGIAHYLIHTYDSPELAELALPAARKYASIAAASAHAQHMPSHIFTRLGLWDESVKSNLSSIAAAQCYASQAGMKGHWDEELHGMDYLVYAYLQQGEDKKAQEQIDYLKSMHQSSPENFKAAYSVIAMPARNAVERRDWAQAAQINHELDSLPGDAFLWERVNTNFCRVLGAVHLGDTKAARHELESIKKIQSALVTKNESYKASLVLVQVKASEAWINLKEGKTSDALKLMTEAADLEDATSKHPVTPGEILPARELLGDMYLELKDYKNAIVAYHSDLTRHKNRFNGLVGLALAEAKSGHVDDARKHIELLGSLPPQSATRSDLVALKKLIN